MGLPTFDVELTVDDVSSDGGALSEGPVWDSLTHWLLWVDILVGAVHVAGLKTGEMETFNIGMPVGSILPRSPTGGVAAVERGFPFLNDGFKLDRPILPAPQQRSGTRFKTESVIRGVGSGRRLSHMMADQTEAVFFGSTRTIPW